MKHTEINQKRLDALTTKEALIEAKERLHKLRQATHKQALRVVALEKKYDEEQRDYFAAARKVQVLPEKKPAGPRKQGASPNKSAMAKAIARLPENLWPELAKAVGITIEDVKAVKC